MLIQRKIIHLYSSKRKPFYFHNTLQLSHKLWRLSCISNPICRIKITYLFLSPYVRNVLIDILVLMDLVLKTFYTGILYV